VHNIIMAEEREREREGGLGKRGSKNFAVGF
jgi:hypothetical protein